MFFYPDNHPEVVLRGKLIEDPQHLKAVQFLDELKFKTPEEIKEMSAQAGNVISFMTGMRMLRSDSFYNQTRDRVAGRNGKIFTSFESPEGPRAA